MKRQTKLLLLFTLIAVAILAVTANAMAWEQRCAEPNRAGQVNVSTGEIINNDLIMSGNTVTMDGTVNGDLVVFAETVKMNGTVQGDLIVFCRDLTVDGRVLHDLRTATQTIKLRGPVSGNLLSACEVFNIEDRGNVAGSATVACRDAQVYGPIGRDFSGGMESLKLDDLIGGGVQVGLGKLELGPQTKIAGNLTYTCKNNAVIDPAASVTGVIKKIKPAVEPKPKTSETVLGFLVKLAGALVLWFAWFNLFPASLGKLQAQLAANPYSSLGWGLVLLIVVPIASILCFITLIGIPVGIIGLASYFLVMMLSGIIVGYRLGQFLIERAKAANWNIRYDQPAAAAIAGMTILMLLAAIPYVGGWVTLLTILLALGAVFLAIRDSVSGSTQETQA